MSQLTTGELQSLAFLNESKLQQSLGEEFSLCDNGNIIFHWADFNETCDAVNEQLNNDPEMRTEFTQKEAALNRLKLIPVWMRTEKKVHQTTMFDLYERYLLNQMEFSLGVDPLGSIEVSFISGTGPFRSMVIAECFNKATYKDFVMVNLLNGKLPKRDFRIRLRSKILMEFGSEFSQASLVNLEQLTMKGMLLSVDADFFQSKISGEEEMRLLVDTQCLLDGCQKNLSELKLHLSQFAFNLMYSSRKEDSLVCKVKDLGPQASFDFMKNKKIFLFISYDKLATSNPKIKNVQKFVNHTKSLIRSHYTNLLFSKSA